MKKRRIVFGAVVAVLLLGAAYLWLGSSVPAGQETLLTLTSENFAEFEKSFDKSGEGPRLVLLLSPT